MNSIEKNARIAGVLYLILAVTGIMGMIYAPTVTRDATVTAQNILANESLFRFHMAIGIISLTSFIFLVLALYRLLKGVNKELALLMVTLVVIGISIAFLNLLNQIMALILLSGADFLKAFEPDQLYALVMVFLKLNGQGTFVVEIFWGLWLFPFGLLVFKSGFLPRILGVLLIMAGSGYLVNSLTHLLFPGYVAVVAPLATVLFFGELPIIFWLLIKGAKVKQPATREAI